MPERLGPFLLSKVQLRGILETKFDCIAGNTSTTKKDRSIQKEYDVYNNQSINIEPHLRSDTGKETDKNFFRTYFAHYKNNQNGERKIVIGSCGGHLTTAGTMHKK